MKKALKKLFAGVLAAGLMISAGAAAEVPDAAAEEQSGWHFDERGFLTGENPGDAYLLEDKEGGGWTVVFMPYSGHGQWSGTAVNLSFKGRMPFLLIDEPKGGFDTMLKV